MITLTNEQRADYDRDGFIIVEDMLPPDELAALIGRVREYTHEGRPLGKIVMQMEPRVRRGEVKVDHPGDGVRKLEGLVEGDELFRRLGTHPKLVSVVEQILGPDLKMFRNALLLKPPLVGSPKGMHQDSPYWPIAPMNLCSCWFPLEDATPENGCMAVIPGWHKMGALPHKHVKDDFVVEESAYDASKMVLKPMRAGSGLFFHSLLPHYTAPNRSPHWRRAIALTYMAATSTFTGEGECPEFLTIKGKSYPGCIR
jgi:phytanoyl-CoA hydroxylase